MLAKRGRLLNVSLPALPNDLGLFLLGHLGGFCLLGDLGLFGRRLVGFCCAGLFACEGKNAPLPLGLPVNVVRSKVDRDQGLCRYPQPPMWKWAPKKQTGANLQAPPKANNQSKRSNQSKQVKALIVGAGCQHKKTIVGASCRASTQNSIWPRLLLMDPVMARIASCPDQDTIDGCGRPVLLHSGHFHELVAKVPCVALVQKVGQGSTAGEKQSAGNANGFVFPGRGWWALGDLMETPQGVYLTTIHPTKAKNLRQHEKSGAPERPGSSKHFPALGNDKVQAGLLQLF